MFILSNELQQEINQTFINDYLVESGSDAKYIYFTHRNSKKSYRMLRETPVRSLVEMPNYTNGNSKD